MMSTGVLSIIIVVSILILLGSGMYISISLAFVGLIIFQLLIPGMTKIIGNVLYNTVANFTLTAIPMFLFMGEIILATGIIKSLYDGISKWVSPFPGGLIHSNIFSCSFFAAISGSSVATAAAMGSIAIPEQKSRKYPIKLITGSLAAGGTLGILIPPSTTMIIYGAMTGQSVGKLFVAGMLPGILMALMFMIYIVVFSIINKKNMPKLERIGIVEYSKRFIYAFKEIWPILLVLFTIFFGIYGGIMTPTEAAAISVVEVLIISFIFGKLSYEVIKVAAQKALKTTAMIMFITIGAQIMGNAISMIKLPAHLCSLVENSGMSRTGVLLTIIAIYIILGCLMDALSAIIITLPITYPLMVTTLNFDPIWYGIILVILNQVGLITPPVGVNSFIIHGLSGEKNIWTTFQGIIPFFLLMCVVIILIILYPEIVLYLPSTMN